MKYMILIMTNLPIDGLNLLLLFVVIENSLLKIINVIRNIHVYLLRILIKYLRTHFLHFQIKTHLLHILINKLHY